MTLLFSSDWHLCMRNLEPCRCAVDQICEILSKSARPRYFAHLGDIVGDRGPANPLDVRVTNFLIEEFPKSRKQSDATVFVRGNHDMIATPDGVPSCVPLLNAIGFDMIADADFTCFQLATAWVWMVPYFRDPVRQKRAFLDAHKSILGSGVKILLFHNEIAGAERNAWSKGEGLTMEDIGASSYDLCVAGHLHRPQFIKPNLYFVGAPYPTDWGDANARQRFLKVEL